RAQLPGDEQCRATSRLAVIRQRAMPAGSIGCDRAQKRAQLAGAIAIEAAISAVREPGDILEGALGGGVMASGEDADRHAEQAELSGEAAELVELFLHRIANKDQRADLLRLGRFQRVTQHARDLCLAAHTEDGAHRTVERLRGREPFARFAFIEAAIEDKLYV